MPANTRLPSDKLKTQLNAKTVNRRKRLADDVRVASNAGGGRNDLLPRLHIVERSSGDLKASRHRARRTTADQVERVISSIKSFGIVVPLLIDRNDVLIAGHVVLDAAKVLGIETLPCVVVDHLSDDEARLLALSLNRIGETGEWDLEQLNIEMTDLSGLNLDLTITGFSRPELDIILADVPAGYDEEQDEPDPDPNAVPVSKAGDLWLLGEHRLLCGDALSGADYVRLMDGRQAQAVFSDPPYNCKIEGFVGGLGKHKHTDFAMAVGEMTDEGFGNFLQTYLELCRANVSECAVVFACMDWRQIDLLLLAGRQAGLTRLNVAVWNKGSGGMGGLYRSAHEFVAVLCNGKSAATNNIELGRHGRDRTNVWNYAGANRRGSSASDALAGHPTPKPVELVVDALLDVTNRGEIVLDPFMGSGTTIIAAEKSGRITFGLELDPKYVDLAIRRWQTATGLQAQLDGSQMTFAEIAAERAGSEQGVDDGNSHDGR